MLFHEAMDMEMIRDQRISEALDNAEKG